MDPSLGLCNLKLTQFFGALFKKRNIKCTYKNYYGFGMSKEVIKIRNV